MDRITNSVVKEAMRCRNESTALTQANQINIRVNQELAALRHKSKYSLAVMGILMVVSGIVFTMMFRFKGILTGAAVGVVIYIIMNLMVWSYNQDIDRRRLNIRAAADKEIKAAHDAADRLTRQQISNYDKEVQAGMNKILKNPAAVKTMVEHTVMMFQRMISHADAGAHMRFVEADFTYAVRRTGIAYYFESRYTNPQDDFNFNKQRFRDLKTDAECEGLAAALARLTTARMKKLYPPNSLNLGVSHIDATVTLHFKAANANFVTARDIL